MACFLTPPEGDPSENFLDETNPAKTTGMRLHNPNFNIFG